MAKDTTYVVDYLKTKVTIYTNDCSFVDFPNSPDVRAEIDKYYNGSKNGKFELKSDSNRYRVYYPQNSLGQLFTDVETIMKQFV